MSYLNIKEIFEKGRTCNSFSDKGVEDSILREIYNLMKFGPTSANCSPLRIKFVKSKENKAKLISDLMDGNKAKTQTAPVVALLAYDEKFYTKLPKLFPHNPNFGKMYENNVSLTFDAAFRNSTLQAAYFITIARALGLDTGPMSGFDAEKVNNDFFAGTSYKINFICSLGYRAEEEVYQRLPRFDFEEVCEII